jgi:hypothetical protein
MTSDNTPVGVQIHAQAKKRLIATLPNSKFDLTHSQQRTLHFSNSNKNQLSATAIF